MLRQYGVQETAVNSLDLDSILKVAHDIDANIPKYGKGEIWNTSGSEYFRSGVVNLQAVVFLTLL